MKDVIPIIDQSNTRRANALERKPILNRCAPEIMQRDVVGDRYRIGIKAKTCKKYKSGVVFIEEKLSDLSSTEIRKKEKI